MIKCIAQGLRRFFTIFGVLFALILAPAHAQQETSPAPDYFDEDRTILVMVHQAPNRLRPGEAYSSGYGNARTTAAQERLGRTIAREHDLKFIERWPMPLLGVDCFVMEVGTDVSIDAVILKLEKNSRVKWAERIAIFETSTQSAARSDPLFSTSPVADDWNLAALHRSWTGTGVPIAVIDTQIDGSHPDLLGQIRLSRNFAPQSPAKPEFHGTEVAGIIAALAHNGIGIRGVAPKARIMALRACWQPGGSARSVCTSLNLARALNFAIEGGAKIINLSLGGPPNRLLTELINSANARGIAVVAAYDPDRPRGGFPASHPSVISVADRGSEVGRGFSAPGTDIPTTRPGGGWHFVTGSSYSAAHVSGLLALSFERSRSERHSWRSLSSVSRTNREIDIKALLGR